MIPQQVPWCDVFPWAQVLGNDGQAYTVLPTYPLFPRCIMRPRGDPHAGGWWLTVQPLDVATVLVPTEMEAIEILRAGLGGLEVVGHETAGGWQCPAILTRAQLVRHLDWFHAYGPAMLGRLGEYETHRLHNGLHQGVSIHPLPVRHLHYREVTT